MRKKQKCYQFSFLLFNFFLNFRDFFRRTFNDDFILIIVEFDMNLKHITAKISLQHKNVLVNMITSFSISYLQSLALAD